MFEHPLAEAGFAALNLGMSYDDLRQMIARAIERAEPSDPDNDGDNDTEVSIEALYPEYVAYCCFGNWDEYKMRTWAIGADGAITVGDPSPVARKTVFFPDPGAEANESAAPEHVYVAEAGSRHNAHDETVLHSIHTHARSIQNHVEELGVSNPAVAQAYSGFFPMMQSARESDAPLQESGADVPIVEVGEATISESTSAPAKGVFEMTIIRPGFNSSGSRYYTKEAIAQAATENLFTNKKMYVDHPTAAEEKALPERSVSKIGAVITESYLGHEGELRGKAAIVNPQLKEMLSLMKEQGLLHHIGVSINATGTVKTGEVEGRRTNIVEAFTSGKSVDFVTEPGAGGRIALYESARGDVPAVDTKESSVNEEQIKDLMARFAALEESNKSLTEKLTESDQRAQQAEARATVQATVAARLAGIAEGELPAIAKERIARIFEGATDAARLDEAIESEKTYVKEVAEKLAPKAAAKGGVTGLGSRVTEGAKDVIAPAKPSENKELIESMAGYMGGEESAKSLLKAMAG